MDSLYFGLQTESRFCQAASASSIPNTGSTRIPRLKSVSHARIDGISQPIDCMKRGRGGGDPDGMRDSGLSKVPDPCGNLTLRKKFGALGGGEG